MDYSKITSEEQYIEMVKQYSYLADYSLSLIEAEIQNSVSPQELINNLLKLISLVNVIGYFRGQDGVLMDFQSLRTNSMSWLRQNEDEFENRLWSIIDYVKADEIAAKQYRAKMLDYYLKNRGIEFGPNTVID